MKHFLTRVARRLLALFLLCTPLMAAETAADLAAARAAAAELMPALQSGSWQASEKAFLAIRRLATSKDKADKELMEKLAEPCATALMGGLQNLPPEPEQERLFKDAEAIADLLLRNATASNVKRARALVEAMEKVPPSRQGVRLLRLDLAVMDKKRQEQIQLAAALLEEKDLMPGNREYVRDVYVRTLLRGRPSPAEDLQRAEAVLHQWQQDERTNLRPRMLLLELYHAWQDWPAQYALATELLADEKLTGTDRKWVHQRRLDAAVKTGRTQELNEQDWSFMFEQITGGKGLKQFLDKYGQVLLGMAFGIGWLWFFIVAILTRCVRSQPPGWWVFLLWATLILYASTVIMAPLVLRVVFSLLGLLFLIFATTGQKAPLGYLVVPQADNESGRARWAAVLGWCFLAFLFIQAFTQGYAWGFERVMGRPVGAQLVAKLLQTNTVPGLLSMVLAGGIFVPFLEEVIFRGLLQDWVGRWVPAGVCVALVSLLFGIIHGLEMAIPIAFIGVLLSLLRLRYRSLWPCVILHALNNSVMIVLLYAVPGLLEK